MSVLVEQLGGYKNLPWLMDTQEQHDQLSYLSAEYSVYYYNMHPT